MVGNSILSEKLRVLTCLELFLNAEFYLSHPYFDSVFDRGVFCNFNSLLSFSLSHHALDTGLKGVKLVQSEAINMCQDNVWSSFLCVLACQVL